MNEGECMMSVDKCNLVTIYGCFITADHINWYKIHLVYNIMRTKLSAITVQIYEL